MSEHKYVVSVCEGPDCTGNGSDALVPVLTSAIARLGIGARCRVKRGGCYGLCHEGANVIVRIDTGAPPDPLSSEDFELQGIAGEHHYDHMDAAKCERMAEAHLAGDAAPRK